LRNEIKQSIKNSIAFVFHLFGIGHLIHYLIREKVTLLSIHSIMSSETQSAWQPVRAQLDPAILERNLEILSKYYNFVSFTDAVAMLNTSAVFGLTGLIMLCNKCHLPL